jgi:hypothetical protein
MCCPTRKKQKTGIENRRVAAFLWFLIDIPSGSRAIELSRNLEMFLSRSCLAALLFASSCSAFSPALVRGCALGQPALGLSTKRATSANSVTGLQCMADKPKLIYFNARGVAETARIMFAAAGADYEDYRYEVAPGQPPVSTPARFQPCVWPRNSVHAMRNGCSRCAETLAKHVYERYIMTLLCFL